MESTSKSTNNTSFPKCWNLSENAKTPCPNNICSTAWSKVSQKSSTSTLFQNCWTLAQSNAKKTLTWKLSSSLLWTDYQDIWPTTILMLKTFKTVATFTVSSNSTSNNLSRILIPVKSKIHWIFTALSCNSPWNATLQNTNTSMKSWKTPPITAQEINQQSMRTVKSTSANSWSTHLTLWEISSWPWMNIQLYLNTSDSKREEKWPNKLLRLSLKVAFLSVIKMLSRNSWSSSIL